MFCTDIPSPVALIFSDSTPQLLYYSHLPVFFTAILIGLLVYSKNKSLEAKVLLAMVSLFSLWVFIDLIVWTNVDSRLVMLVWSMMNFVAILIAVATLYFAYVFLEKKDVSFRIKALIVALLAPYLFMLPSYANIPTFDITLCEAVQGPLIYYFYFLQALFLSWLSLYLIYKYVKAPAKKKRETLFLGLGAAFFLFTFFGGTFAASYFDNWQYEQYGLFGMLVFLSLLTVLIVRYEAFKMKVHSAQALVIALVILIGSQFFFIQNTINVVLNGITFLLILFFGYILIRSVKNEVQRKEELEQMTSRLATVNQELRKLDSAKSEFISIASHQLRTPLTAIKGYTSLILEGSYGEVSTAVQDVLNKVYVVNNRMSQLVEDLLNVSRIESGRVQYNFVPTQLELLVAEIVDVFTIFAKSKKLSLKIRLPKKELPKLSLDANKIKEVVSNLIDNALKYTKEGGVTISVEEKDGSAHITVADTGIGIRPEDMARVFEKFTRSTETIKLDVSGTGLGLYVGKNFIAAHGGKIRVESDGPGKGTRFIIELPLPPEGK